MIAMTRSAAITPSSMSFASSLASATEWIGTLRTSMASGMGFLSVAGFRDGRGYDDGAGVAGRRAVGEMGEVGDDGRASRRRSTNRQAASTFGPIEPLAKWPSAA